MFCPSCGKEVPDHSSFCLRCGKAISVVPVLASSSSVQVKRSGVRTFFTIFLVLFCGLMLIVIVSNIVAFNNPGRGPDDYIAQEAAARYPISSSIFGPTNIGKLMGVRADGSSGAAQAPPPAFVSKREKLVSGQIVVGPGQMQWIRFQVDTTKMMSVRVVGRFNVSGGTGNDIQAALADEDNFENWKNGHPASVLYDTGKTTVGSLDVRIGAPGTYYLAFSNKFSALSQKYVYPDIELQYQARVF